MGMIVRNVKWEKLASRQLRDSVNFIKQNSFQNSIKVSKDILAITRSLALPPEKFPLDKYKIKNDGTYRAFEKHCYRVVYRVLDNEIKIITLRHTSMEPLEY